MRYDLKKPCPECPYTPKMRGWIGSHDSAMEFHEVVQQDAPFSCHMSPEQCCAGNALYMNRLCKVSRDPDKAQFQKKLKDSLEPVVFSFDGQALVDFHGK